MLLIGSRAAKIHYPEFRKPKDYDFIATEKETNDFLSKFTWTDISTHAKKRRAKVSLNNESVNFEFDLIEHCESSKLLYELNHKSIYDDDLNISYNLASSEILFSLKKSHITHNIHWRKNIVDYLFLKEKLHSSEINKSIKDIYNLRVEEIKNRINKKSINFDVDNSEFFRKSESFVDRVVDHDSLHYATCFYDKPLFLSGKSDLTKAELSEDKVFSMSNYMIIQMIQEECMALALEREIIPCMMKKISYNQKQAYLNIACKMVHNFLPDFLKIFAADNFLEIVDLKIDYVKKCLSNHPTIKEIINGNLH